MLLGVVLLGVVLLGVVLLGVVLLGVVLLGVVLLGVVLLGVADVMGVCIADGRSPGPASLPHSRRDVYAVC